MSDIKAEPVAWLHTQGNFHEASMRELTDDERDRGWTQHPLYTADAIRQAVLAERERCARIVETYRVPVGNSSAGEMAAEWTMDALESIRDDIRKEPK